ncbi:MAG: exo-rhamnogalacturonan lyase family protein, partial [Planctomycetota bacterium]
MSKFRPALAAATALLLAAPAAALEVRLTVKDDAGAERKPGTVTSGVPFAKGAVKDLTKLSVSVGGKKVPAQFRKLAVWEDGSIRWALLDCQAQVPAKGKAELVLRDSGGNPAPPSPVRVSDSPAEVKISTGPLEAVIDKKSFNLFKSVKVDGKELITAKSKGLVLYTADAVKMVPKKGGRRGETVEQRGEGGIVTAGAPEVVKVEEAGPLRAVVLLRGKFPGVHQGLLGYTVRVTAFAGQKFIKFRTWFENHGQHGYCPRGKKHNPEWFPFDGMSVELDLGLGASPGAECEGVKGSGKLKVYQSCRNAKTYPEPAYGYKRLEYRITSGDKELKKGQHTDAVTTISGGGGQVTVAIRNFWENYYKALELDGSTLKLWFWPMEGRYPRKFFDHHCPGYARKQIMPLWKPGLYNLPGSVHKGYETVLDFSGRPAAESAAELSRPLFAVAPAEYYA